MRSSIPMLMLIISIILIFSESALSLFTLRWLFRFHNAPYYHPINMFILNTTQSIHRYLTHWFPSNSKVDGPSLFVIGALCCFQSALKLLASGYPVWSLTFLIWVSLLEALNNFLSIYLLCGMVVIISNFKPYPIPLAQLGFQLIAGQLDLLRFLMSRTGQAISSNRLCIAWFVLMLMVKLFVRGLMPI